MARSARALRKPRSEGTHERMHDKRPRVTFEHTIKRTAPPRAHQDSDGEAWDDEDSHGEARETARDRKKQGRDIGRKSEEERRRQRSGGAEGTRSGGYWPPRRSPRRCIKVPRVPLLEFDEKEDDEFALKKSRKSPPPESSRRGSRRDSPPPESSRNGGGA